jgi:HNH endonuclease
MTNDSPRRTVTSRLRFEILRRDNFRCTYCGAGVDESGSGLTVDHVTPVALGGTNEPTNLVAACRDCNAGKTSTAPGSALIAGGAKADDDHAEALEAVARRDALAYKVEQDVVDAFDQVWDLGQVWDGDSSLRALARRGITPEDVRHFRNIVAGKGMSGASAWKYFCGCCWRVARERQEIVAPVADPIPARTPEQEAQVALTLAIAGERHYFGWCFGRFQVPIDKAMVIFEVLKDSDDRSGRDMKFLANALLDGMEEGYSEDET